MSAVVHGASTPIESAPVPLSQENLGRIAQHLSEAEIQVPNYNRQNLSERIVHIGVGNFFRAHLAVYVDDLIRKGSDWSICGVGLMPGDVGMRDVMRAQDCLSTVVERGSETTRARIIGSMTSFMHAPADPEAVIAKLAHPNTKIVTLTVTEAGYFFVEDEEDLDMHHPDIAHDLTSPETPRTMYGYLCQALERRFAAGIPPFTVMSCDNVQQNGDLTRQMLLRFMQIRGSPAHAWLDSNGAFPNSMVDRITPRSTPELRELLMQNFGVDDAWPVPTEEFSQFVLEANKCADGRPAWESVGVHVVECVEPFELMKLRLLNAGHSALGYLGHLAGHTYIHEVVADPVFRTFVQRLMREEVVPLLPSIPGIDLDEYCRTLLVRFGNTAIRDLVSRICLNGSAKMPKFILASIRDHIQKQENAHQTVTAPPLLTLCVAGWFRYLTGMDESGHSYVIEDTMAKELLPLATAGGADPSALLSVHSMFCGHVAGTPSFVAELTTALGMLYSRGVRATMTHYVPME